MIAIGVPLMLLAGFATHMNSRASVARQSAEAAANPQTAMMNRLALYIFPLGWWSAVRSCRWRSSSTGFRTTSGRSASSTMCSGRSPKEEEAKKQEALARRAANAPAPGAKPTRPPKKRAASADGPDDTEEGQTWGEHRGYGWQSPKSENDQAGRGRSQQRRLRRPNAATGRATEET